MEITKDLIGKYEKLKEYIINLGSLAVAYSGGVDSAFLLYAANEALKNTKESNELKLVAITVDSVLFPHREKDESVEFCKEHNIKQVLMEYNPLKIEGFSDNPSNRCYICKTALMSSIKACASDLGIKNVAEGSNLDDLKDYRPGLKALNEQGIISPLRDMELTKKDIRALSQYFGLVTWNKPSYACLASRIPYGDKIDDKKLKMVNEAEMHLVDMGFEGMRVRMHGNLARIEVSKKDIVRIIKDDIREEIVSKFREIGFDYITIDLLGYRTGSLNEVISKRTV